MKKIKNSIKTRLNTFKYERTEAYQNDRLIYGESILSSKMLIWDSEKYPFVPSNWDLYGFKVFSQNNEDGLIQYIIHHTDLKNKRFVEFGVENYSEANTRFLLWNNNWTGLVMDGSEEWMNKLKSQSIYWKRTVNSRGVFITKENINRVISEEGYGGVIALLSVDIDGNDYWVLESIKCISPQIIICEYNPIFGSIEKVSIPYKENFYRTNAHFSNLYYGASLGAFVYLLEKKGYKLICVNNIGNNAFFVKREDSDIPEVGIEDAWREPRFRESRDRDGNLTFLSVKDGRNLIKSMPVIDVTTGEEKKVLDLFIDSTYE